ncbi:restriction endonuclease subunit S [Pseudomonas alcaligenes]|uniref:restriction endonuclease subunit S n=1 Tax=Aquipseudomonas alcaligenes TaxID=43263 RepID=UPI002E7BDC0F|nr:restriction endonuclease subunit S [Pseudomonas alcaligenes]MEE1950319.1 restriction endonuclease subunit S [Pseudomonas alcaligenes]
MSFPKYPEYKDSGVEWFGDVPCDWRVQRLKQVVNPSRPITYGIVQAGENVPDGIPYIRPADMADESGVKTEDALLRTSQEIASAYRRSSISAGDIVCSIGPSFGKLMMVPLSLEGANLTQGTARVAVANEHVPRFIFWVLRSVESYQQWESSVGGATFRALNLGPLAETFLCVPSWAEQTQIARFLDHETARIDALIEEQQRLIELLKEKRQAVISHAVTKGLDPTVPIKDSGVEWLGEVPAHWEVCALMNLTAPGRAIMYGIVLPGENVEDGIPIVKGGDVKPSRLVLDLLCRTTREIEASFARARLKPKDVVYSIRGTIGDAELVPDDFAHVNITQDVARISPREDIDSGWLLYVMRSKPVFVQLEQRSLGAAVRGINICDLKRAKIPVPPALERVRIAEFIRLEVSRLDELMLEASGGIGLLQERRSALISAAVTGKIDVRSWQPPVSTQAPESAAEAV